MTDIQTIGTFLESPNWTDGEKWVIKWQFGLLGDFHTALSNAIASADENNLRLLRYGFPQEVEAFNQWRIGDLAQRLHKAGLDI